MHSELKALQEFKEKHSNGHSSHTTLAQNSESHSKDSDVVSHSNSNLTKSGEGCTDELSCGETCDPCDQSASEHCNCEKEKDNYNPDLTTVLPKESPHVELQKESRTDTQIPKALVASKLWKRHQHKASTILDALEASGHFKIDQFSMVYIDNVPLNLSIFHLMKITFQPIKKHLDKIDLYVKLLKDLNVVKYVTNKYLLIEDNQSSPFIAKYWYYLGN